MVFCYGRLSRLRNTTRKLAMSISSPDFKSRFWDSKSLVICWAFHGNPVVKTIQTLKNIKQPLEILLKLSLKSPLQVQTHEEIFWKLWETAKKLMFKWEKWWVKAKNLLTAPVHSSVWLLATYTDKQYVIKESFFKKWNVIKQKFILNRLELAQLAWSILSYLHWEAPRVAKHLS